MARLLARTRFLIVVPII